MIPKPEQFMDEARQLAAQCWCDEETKHTEMDVVLAHAVAQRIAAWMATSAEMSNNAEFYRGIVVKTGDLFGNDARTSDDGSIQDSVLALKVPELVAGLFKALEIANRSADEQMRHKREAETKAAGLRQSLDLLAKDMTTCRDLLSRALEDLPETPSPNCSCHVSAPCSDCINYSGRRELTKEINAALKP